MQGPSGPSPSCYACFPQVPRFTFFPFIVAEGAVPHKRSCSIATALLTSPPDSAASCLASTADRSRHSAAAMAERPLAVAAVVTVFKCSCRTPHPSKARIRSWPHQAAYGTGEFPRQVRSKRLLLQRPQLWGSAMPGWRDSCNLVATYQQSGVYRVHLSGFKQHNRFQTLALALTCIGVKAVPDRWCPLKNVTKGLLPKVIACAMSRQMLASLRPAQRER